jgi:putative heme iron utilization protein
MNTITTEIIELLNTSKSLVLSTITDNTQPPEPEASYSPFVYEEGCLYILVSELASHTRNLQVSPYASILILEDESCTKNIYGRRRLSLFCNAKRISRHQALYETILNQMEARHGKTVILLRQLPDFLLFQLYPQRGNYIKGFGQAYELVNGNLEQAIPVTKERVQEKFGTD